MTKIIKKQLQEKINNLLEIYRGLKKLQRFTLKDLKENIENIWSVTFGLIAALRRFWISVNMYWQIRV